MIFERAESFSCRFSGYENRIFLLWVRRRKSYLCDNWFASELFLPDGMDDEGCQMNFGMTRVDYMHCLLH